MNEVESAITGRMMYSSCPPCQPPPELSEARQNHRPQREDQHQDRREDEVGQHLRADRDADGKVIQPGVVAYGGDDAKRATDQHGDHEAPEPVGERHGKTLRDQVVYVLVAVDEGGAEIELRDQVPDVGADLHDKGLIQPVLPLQVGQHGGRHAAFRGKGAARRGIHQDEGAHDQDQHDRNRDQQAFENIAEHGGPLREGGARRKGPPRQMGHSATR